MARLRHTGLPLALAIASGCTASAIDARGDGGHGRAETLPMRVCENGEVPATAGGSFRHVASTVIAALGSVHSSDDVIAVVDAEAPRVRAKLAYGPTSKDLEDEWVEIRVDDCAGGSRHLGFALTDGDGRIDAAIDAGDLPEPGRHRLTLRVWGDGTRAHARLFVVPQDTEVVVFDIDGTLTTSDLELFADLVHDLFAPILAGDHVPAAREGAAETTRLRATQGYLPLYLTGRPYWLTARTRAWLAAIDAAPGALVLAPRTADAWPTNAGVGTFKAETLAAFQLSGLSIARAYGNASTDVWAYDESGLPPAHVFVLGTHGGLGGARALGESYAAHLDEVAQDPGPAAPLSWP